MTSFDLKDEYHCVAIHPQFRRCFTFHMDGEFFQCATLPMGWLNSPFVFTKEGRTLPRHASEAPELYKRLHSRAN